MGYKKRGYNRNTPIHLVRDYKLFVIACEGAKREPESQNDKSLSIGRSYLKRGWYE
jgi:hypothetical protein